MSRFPHTLLLTLLALPLLPALAQDSWEENVRNFSGSVTLSAPGGYRTFSAPVASAAPTGTIAGPATVEVAGFIEAGSTRFYVTVASIDPWIKTGADRVWITADDAVLPPLPKLLKRGPGEDPDSGETVMIEAYEETVTILPESRWPAPEAKAVDFFPAALLAIGEDPAGNTTADFQLFRNNDANKTGYPFVEPYYGGLDTGMVGALIRLYSTPSIVNVRLLISGQSTVLPLLQPGLVFLAGFSPEGSLVRLSIGGDARSESAPVSSLGAPVFRREEKLVFGFSATEVTGAGVPLHVAPDRIAGADYTKYNLLSQMGAPFDDYSPPEFQSNWTLHIERDLTMTLLAPLYDGRGAPGMLELEGLSLDPAPAGPDPDNFTEAQFAEFSQKLSEPTDPALFGEGWKSILATKLGDIPASQRVSETESSDGDN